MRHRAVLLLFITLLATAFSGGSMGQTGSEAKRAFLEIDQMAQGHMSAATFAETRKNTAKSALSKLPANPDGADLYYVARLEETAEAWPKAVGHYKDLLALPETDQEVKLNRFTAQIRLKDAFIKAGMAAEGEKYYASDPLALGLFVSMLDQTDRAIKIYEDYIESNPASEGAQRAKRIIVATLGTPDRAEEMARRLELYKADLTPNSIANGYSTLARLYYEKGDREKSAKYTELLIDYGKKAPAGKGVDGVLNAHLDWNIKNLESSGSPAQLNDFLLRIRTEFAEKKSVMDHLSTRDVFQSVLNKPAKELEIEYFLNGKQVNLRALHGRVVLLDFLAHWCGPCIAGFPFVRDLQKRYEAKGLTLLGLSGIYGFYRGERPLGPEEEIKRMREVFLKEYQVTWPLIFTKSDVNTKNYGVSGIPHLVLIDRKGIVRYAKVGKGSEEEIETMLVKLLAEPAAKEEHASSR